MPSNKHKKVLKIYAYSLELRALVLVRARACSFSIDSFKWPREQQHKISPIPSSGHVNDNQNLTIDSFIQSIPSSGHVNDNKNLTLGHSIFPRVHPLLRPKLPKPKTPERQNSHFQK